MSRFLCFMFYVKWLCWIVSGFLSGGGRFFDGAHKGIAAVLW